MSTYPYINGRAYDHASAEIQLGDTIFTAITAVDWDESLTPGKVRGTRPEKLARTLGEHDAEASMKMPLTEFIALITKLGDGWGAQSFNVVANYSDEGQANTKVELVAARIVKHTGGSETGGDPVIEDISLDVMRIEMNGLKMVPGMLV